MKYIIYMFALFFLSCDPYDDRLKLVNLSDEDIFVYQTIGEDEYHNNFDTLRKFYSDSLETNFSANNFVNVKDTTHLYIMGKWDGLLKRDNLRIYLFKKHNFISWIRGDVSLDTIYVRKEFSLNDLYELNWLIVYKSD